MSVETVNGALTVSQAINAGAGTVTLTANGTGSDLTVGSTVNSDSGLITLKAADAVTLNSTVGNSGTSAITVQANYDGVLGSGETGLLDINAALGNSASGAIQLSGNAVSVDAPVNSASFVQVTATTGAMNVNSSITTAAGGGGVVTLNAAGMLELAEAGDISADGAVTMTAGGGIRTAGEITTTADDVTLSSNTTLIGDVAMDTGAGAGNVAFNGTLTATNAGLDDLAITAGTGNVTFGGTVGATRLGNILINSATDVSVNAALTAASLRQVAGTGTTTLNGAVNVNAVVPGATAAGVVLANNNLTVTATGSVATNGKDLFFAADDMSLGGAAGSIDVGSGNATLTTQSAGQPITLGATGGLSLTTTELNTLANASTVSIGTDSTSALLSMPAHAATITVAGPLAPNSAGLNAFKITNAGTAGDSVIFSDTLTSPKPVTVTTEAGNIKFNATGKILANGAATTDRVVNLTATAGAIDGNATNVDDYIAANPALNVNVQADRLNATARDGVGVTNALVTQINDLQATTTNADINVYNVGALDIAGSSGVNAGATTTTPVVNTGGDVTLIATGAITQSAPIVSDALNVITLNSPGANITLANTSNDAASYSLFACLALPGGCPTDTPILSTNGTKFGIGTNTNYAAGTINYRDSNGANLSGIGTVSAFSTFTNGNTTVTANSITASDITLEASGNITLEFGSNLTKINNAGTGSFNLIAGGNITMLDSSGTIGTSASTFNHDLNLTAAGNIALNESVYQATKNLTLTGNASGLTSTGNQILTPTGSGSVTLQGNHVVSTGGDVTIRGVNFSLLGRTPLDPSDPSGQSPNGQELTATETINLLNSGVITVQGGTADATSAGGARMTGSTINIGTSGGSSNPIRMLVQGGTNNNFGYVTSNTSDPLIEARQPDAIVKSTGQMSVYLRSDPAALDTSFGNPYPYSLQLVGGTATVNDNGGQFRFATALAAMRAKNMTMVADGTVLIQGGTTNLNATGSLASSSAIILVETEKRLTTTTPNASVIVRGGTANVSNSLTSISASNATALGQLDPSKLFLNVGGRLVLEGGRHTGPAGSLTSGRIDAGDEIQISVFGAPAPYTYTTSAGTTNTVTGSFLMIGGRNSGFYDSFNIPLGGASYPKEFPITVSMLGDPAGYLRVPDSGLGDGIVQTGLHVFDESLLSYIIFAANEETRAARIRRGAGEGDDVGAAACK
ncbi:MAG: hypothetical protein EPO20_27270 [Betaproteobacteria bacterium]|nr:MAG: hypothetical protein EPO20_27270 [Betaproteobacteria bacterium]